MRQPLPIIAILACFLFLFSYSPTSIYAQGDARPQAESSFEVMLSIVAGSNEPTQKNELPAALAPIAKQLRASFGFNSFRLADTYIGRVGNNGTISYKSLADINGRDQQDTPSFLDWNIVKLNNMAGANTFFIQAFQFGARVPVRISGPPDPSGKMTSSIQYESLGLTVDRLTVGANSPVLIGTIALPRTDGRVFLVLTISPAAN